MERGRRLLGSLWESFRRHRCLRRPVVIWTLTRDDSGRWVGHLLIVLVRVGLLNRHRLSRYTSTGRRQTRGGLHDGPRCGVPVHPCRGSVSVSYLRAPVTLECRSFVTPNCDYLYPRTHFDGSQLRSGTEDSRHTGTRSVHWRDKESEEETVRGRRTVASHLVRSTRSISGSSDRRE